MPRIDLLQCLRSGDMGDKHPKLGSVYGPCKLLEGIMGRQTKWEGARENWQSWQVIGWSHSQEGPSDWAGGWKVGEDGEDKR